MRFLLLTLLLAALVLPACNSKNKKTSVTETTVTEDTTITIEPNPAPMPPPPDLQTAPDLQPEPKTFKDAVIKFFSPSSSKTEDKKKDEIINAKADEKSANQVTSTTKPEETKPQIPTFPELMAKDDAHAYIMKTEDGRLTPPLYFAKEMSAKNTKQLKLPTWYGEKLKYNIGWSFIVAGVAELNTEKIIDNNGKPAYVLEAKANSHSVIDSMFKVRDTNISWLDEDIKSIGYWQSVREGKYARDEWAIFDYKNHVYNNHKQDRDGNVKTQKMAFTGDRVLDMLSSLYYVRSQELKENSVIYFDIINRKQQYPLKVTVYGKKKIKVKAGEFNCILVEPQFSGEGIFTAKGKSLKVWLTDDEYRIPVKMSVEVFIGSVTAELTQYSINSQKSEQQKA